MAVTCASEVMLDWGPMGWPLRRQAQKQSSKRLPLTLESCRGSGPGNYKLATDLIGDLNTRLRADSQGLLTRGSGVSVRIKRGSAGSWEQEVAGMGDQVVCVFNLMYPEDAAVCAAVCLKGTICVRLRGARSLSSNYLSLVHQLLTAGFLFSMS